MRKLVTIGATAMMGFTALGGLQGVSQAVENHDGPVAGVVNTFAKDILGNSVYADTLINIFQNEDGTRFYLGSKGLMASDNIGKVEKLKDGEFVEQARNESTWVYDKNVQVGDIYRLTPNISLTSEDGTQLAAEKVYKLKIGENNGEKCFVLMQEDYNSDVQVTYEHTETPGEPAWYGVVPAAITFTDGNKKEGLDASVKIVNADNQQTAYTGSKTVKVKVKSGNGFDLKDGEKSAVEYSLTKQDGSAVTKNQTEQELGTLSKDTATINSKATLKGEAKETGTYVDTLTYHFSEQ